MSGSSVSYTYFAAPQAAPGQLAGQPFIVRSIDGTSIPLDLQNSDYQAFLAWLAAGNPAPAGWTGPTNPPAGGTTG